MLTLGVFYSVALQAIASPYPKPMMPGQEIVGLPESSGSGKKLARQGAFLQRYRGVKFNENVVVKDVDGTTAFAKTEFGSKSKPKFERKLLSNLNKEEDDMPSFKAPPVSLKDRVKNWTPGLKKDPIRTASWVYPTGTLPEPPSKSALKKVASAESSESKD